VTILSELDPDVAYPATPTVPESGQHAMARYAAFGALRAWYAPRRDCWVGEDRNVYYRNGDPDIVLAPDVFVCFGVNPEQLELAISYRVWEVGAPPAFVLEIASEKTAKVDLEEKPAKYLAMGVSEYWRFDPSGGDLYTPILQGDRRAGRRWQPIAVTADRRGRPSGHSDTLDLTLHAEGHRLRFCDPHTDTPLPDPDEQAAAAAAERARADQEAAAAAAERARADQEAAAAAAERARADQEAAAAAAERARADRAEAELAALRRHLDEQ